MRKHLGFTLLTESAGGSLIIRELRKGDVGAFFQCLKACFADEFEVEGFDENVSRRIFGRRFSILGRILFGLLGLVDREPIKLFVADVDGALVGTAFMQKHREIGFLTTVMVDPNHRRKEIGSALLKAAIGYARKRKSARIVLEVASTNNPAKGLYDKFGFKKFDETVYLTADIDSLPRLGGAAEIKIRDFKTPDIDNVYELMKNSRGSTMLDMVGFKKSDLRTSWWNRIFSMSTRKKFVAVIDDKVVGYIYFGYTTSKVLGRISTIEASPVVVSKGVEEELVATSVDHIKSSGTKKILVTIPQARQELIEKLMTLGFEKRLFMESMVLELSSMARF